MTIKKEVRRPPGKTVSPIGPSCSHEVLDPDTSVVLVGVGSNSVVCSTDTTCKGVGGDPVTGLEANVGLEGVSGDTSHHLQGHIRAVEDTSVIGVGALITGNVVLGVRHVGRVRIDEDLQFAVDRTSEQVALVVDVQVSVQSRGVVQNTCHGEGGSHVSRTDDQVALPSTSLLGDSVTVSFDLEQKTLELLNTPATVGVDVEVEHALVGDVVLSTGDSGLINSTEDFTVDFSQDLGAEDVSQFSFGVQTVDGSQVLEQAQGCTEPSGHDPWLRPRTSRC